MKSLITIVAVGVLMVAGCREAEVSGPPELKLGQDQCEHCGMLINDARFAACAIIQTDKGRRAAMFDDIGDLVEYASDKPEVHIHERYVKDFETREWIKADLASFVQIPDLHTPMGSGLIAFSSREEASRKNGEVRSFKDLKPSASTQPHHGHE